MKVDPIDILMDKLFSFVDLDRNIVSDDDRETLYKQLEEVGLSPDTAVILFESQNNTLAKVPLDTDSDLPKTLLIKPASGAVKVHIAFVNNAPQPQPHQHLAYSS